MRPSEGRLARLEKKVRELTGEPLIVSYQTVDGEEHEGDVSQMLEDHGYFLRVLHGGSLTDLDRIIAAFLADVEAEA